MIYIGFLLFLLIVFSHRKEFQNWAEADFDQKGWALVSLFGAVVFGVLSLLSLLGAFD